jgi:hypothetical protein
MAKLLKKLFWPIVVLSLIALYANLRVERFRAAAAPRAAVPRAAPAVLAKPGKDGKKKEEKKK